MNPLAAIEASRRPAAPHHVSPGFSSSPPISPHDVPSSSADLFPRTGQSSSAGDSEPAGESGLMKMTPDSTDGPLWPHRPSFELDRLNRLLRRSPTYNEIELGFGKSGLNRIRQSVGHFSARAPLTPELPLDIQTEAGLTLTSGNSTVPTYQISDDINKFPYESLHSLSFSFMVPDPSYLRTRVLSRSLGTLSGTCSPKTALPGSVGTARVPPGRKFREMELLVHHSVFGPEMRFNSFDFCPPGPLTGPAWMDSLNIYEKTLELGRAEKEPRGAEGGTPSEPPKQEIQEATRGAVERLSIQETDQRGIIENESPGQISCSETCSLESTRGSQTEHGKNTLDSKRGIPSEFTRRVVSSPTVDTQPDLEISVSSGSEVAEKRPTAARWGSSLKLTTLTSCRDPTWGPVRVPHGFGPRQNFSSQAIFTTERQAPWTITAANDLACLVFAVTRAEIRKLGILEVVQEFRRTWLSKKLGQRDSDVDRKENREERKPEEVETSCRGASGISASLGTGITAKLLSKPPSRWSCTRNKLNTEPSPAMPSVSANLSSSSPSSDFASIHSSPPSTSPPTPVSSPSTSASSSALGDRNSSGVLLCGEIVPIVKRNGAAGSASVWVKEKRGVLIWIVEEIVEDVSFVLVNPSGCIGKAWFPTDNIWRSGLLYEGLNLSVLIPGLNKEIKNGARVCGLPRIGDQRYYTAQTADKNTIPVLFEWVDNQTLPIRVPIKNHSSGESEMTELTVGNDRGMSRISTLPNAAGIIILESTTLKIRSSNPGISGVLFGREQLMGMHINEVVPSFDQLLKIVKEARELPFADGTVIPEIIFRKARAIHEMTKTSPEVREFDNISSTSLETMASVYNSGGLCANHRDGGKLMVDIQMRVLKDEHDADNPEIFYALWVSYCRYFHSSAVKGEGRRAINPLMSRPGTPPCQPGPRPGLTEQSDDAESETYSEWRDSAESSTDSSASSDVDEGRLAEAQSQKSEAPDGSNGDGTTGSHGSSLSTVRATSRKKTIDDFVILDEMGQGAYGQVKLCRHKVTNKTLVIKYVIKSRILVDTWTRDRKLGTVPLEIHVLDYLRRPGLRHANIIEMSGFFEDEINYYIEIIPHGLPGMDLFDYIELQAKMGNDECRKIFAQLAAAVHHLHLKAKVVHRDIKDENVILDGYGNIKLTDFGSAAYIKNGPFDVFVGTVDYAAPEVLAGLTYDGKEQDVWALGILLYTLVYRENPFYSVDEIVDQNPVLRVPYVYDQACLNLIRLMLEPNVKQRATIEAVCCHEWCRAEVLAVGQRSMNESMRVGVR